MRRAHHVGPAQRRQGCRSGVRRGEACRRVRIGGPGTHPRHPRSLPGSAFPEAYRVETAGDVTTITGSSATGVFHGTRTLLQVLRQKGELSGRITDWPTYTQRGLMVDVGRKHARCRGKQQKGQTGRSVRIAFERPRERAEHIVGSFADRFPTRVRLITGSTPVIRRAHCLPDAEGLPRIGRGRYSEAGRAGTDPGHPAC
ncbi:glycoside hydrolase family 20 zincin-like fold domain-containing protein [Streptomyces sp. NPDC057582]|uniref:glycoside hydrolase family 20 zincin-like fold domain-containing protein n=1 Tax=Streptomyces sp. NPDC057582 TaxID=3346174 RepID=UPI0036C47B7A